MNEYNKRQWDFVTYDMVSKLLEHSVDLPFETIVRDWQIHKNLKPDGLLGPITRGSLTDKQLHQHALKYLGQGEEGSNNSGPFIDKMINTLGLSWLEEPLWCALFVSYVIYEVTGNKLGLSPSVVRFYNNMVSEGRVKEISEEDIQPGDIIIWPRGTRPMGHIGFFEELTPKGLWKTIEGNVGPFPARVSRFVRDPVSNPSTTVLRLQF